jgi:hypothetical protein
MYIFFLIYIGVGKEWREDLPRFTDKNTVHLKVYWIPIGELVSGIGAVDSIALIINTLFDA